MSCGTDIDNYDQLLESVYNSVYENYENIIKNENIRKLLDVKSNTLCVKLRIYDPDMTDIELQCKTFTILYMLILMTFCQQWLKV